MPRYAGLLLPLFLLAGCMTKESPYRAPMRVDVDPSLLDESTLIEYRELSRSDFKADLPPAGMDSRHVAALTIALVRATGAIINVEKVVKGDSLFYEATIDSFQFGAWMDQSQSWWNPKQKHAEQVLEHEQIHFAFSELGARKANAEIDRIRDRIRVTARSPEGALGAARKRFDREAARVQDGVHARNAEFDLDTMNGQRSERNHEWFARIQRELEITEPAF